MKPVKLIVHGIILAVILSPLFPLWCRAASQEELFEKIRLLEVQIQELKELKAQQNKTEEKKQHCIKAVGNEKFCTCLAEALPDDIGFEQYVHVLIAPSEQFSDSSKKRPGQESVDAVHAARKKCI
jgi:hypothetical protein